MKFSVINEDCFCVKFIPHFANFWCLVPKLLKTLDFLNSAKERQRFVANKLC